MTKEHGGGSHEAIAGAASKAAAAEARIKVGEAAKASVRNGREQRRKRKECTSMARARLFARVVGESRARHALGPIAWRMVLLLPAHEERRSLQHAADARRHAGQKVGRCGTRKKKRQRQRQRGQSWGKKRHGLCGTSVRTMLCRCCLCLCLLLLMPLPIAVHCLLVRRLTSGGARASIQRVGEATRARERSNLCANKKSTQRRSQLANKRARSKLPQAAANLAHKTCRRQMWGAQNQHETQHQTVGCIETTASLPKTLPGKS